MLTVKSTFSKCSLCVCVCYVSIILLFLLCWCPHRELTLSILGKVSLLSPWNPPPVCGQLWKFSMEFHAFIHTCITKSSNEVYAARQSGFVRPDPTGRLSPEASCCESKGDGRPSYQRPCRSAFPRLWGSGWPSGDKSHLCDFSDFKNRAHYHPLFSDTFFSFPFRKLPPKHCLWPIPLSLLACNCGTCSTQSSQPGLKATVLCLTGLLMPWSFYLQRPEILACSLSSISLLEAWPFWF